MNLSQKVAYNTGILFVGRILGLAAGLVTLRLTATYFGVSTFGSYSIILSLTGLAAIVADFGVVTTLAREVAKAPGEADRLGGVLLRFRLVSSVGAALLVLAAIPFLPYSHETKVGLAVSLVGMVFTILGAFPTAFFQTGLRQDYAAAIDVSTRLLGLAAIVAVRRLDLGFYGLVGLMIVVNGVACLGAFALSRRFWRINLHSDWKRAKPLIRDSLAIGLVSMIGLLHFRGDAILLSLLRPAGDVGIYAVAYRFVDQAFMLPGLFVATVFPIITRAIHENVENAGRRINRTFQVLVLGAIAMTIFLYVLAPPLVHLVAGAEFDASVRPLRILSFSLVFIFVAPVFYNVLIAINKQRQLIVVGLASLALNVTLNLILIPRYSYDGAAAATVVSEAFSLAATFVVARAHYAFRLERLFVVRALAAAACAAGAVVLLRDESAWLAVAVAEAAFCFAAYTFRAVRPADLRVVLRHSTG